MLVLLFFFQLFFLSFPSFLFLLLCPISFLSLLFISLISSEINIQLGNFTLKSRKVQLIQNFMDVEVYDDYVERFGVDEKQCAEVSPFKTCLLLSFGGVQNFSCCYFSNYCQQFF